MLTTSVKNQIEQLKTIIEKQKIEIEKLKKPRKKMTEEQKQKIKDKKEKINALADNVLVEDDEQYIKFKVFYFDMSKIRINDFYEYIKIPISKYIISNELN